jgi:hypothetical protein
MFCESEQSQKLKVVHSNKKKIILGVVSPLLSNRTYTAHVVPTSNAGDGWLCMPPVFTTTGTVIFLT